MICNGIKIVLFTIGLSTMAVCATDCECSGTKGETGTKCPSGPVCLKGERGWAGIPGHPGGRGSKGDRGFPGIPGSPGLLGTAGVKGDKGDCPSASLSLTTLMPSVHNNPSPQQVTKQIYYPQTICLGIDQKVREVSEDNLVAPPNMCIVYVPKCTNLSAAENFCRSKLNGLLFNLKLELSSWKRLRPTLQRLSVLAVNGDDDQGKSSKECDLLKPWVHVLKTCDKWYDTAECTSFMGTTIVNLIDDSAWSSAELRSRFDVNVNKATLAPFVCSFYAHNF